MVRSSCDELTGTMSDPSPRHQEQQRPCQWPLRVGLVSELTIRFGITSSVQSERDGGGGLSTRGDPDGFAGVIAATERGFVDESRRRSSMPVSSPASMPGENRRRNCSIVFVSDSESTSMSVCRRLLPGPWNEPIGRFHGTEKFACVRLDAYRADYSGELRPSAGASGRRRGALCRFEPLNGPGDWPRAPKARRVTNRTMSCCPFSNNNAVEENQ